jgi:hypothetical protein
VRRVGDQRIAVRRRGMASLRFSIVLMLLLVAPHAVAADIGEPGEALSVSVHGFASQGFILTSRNNYLGADTKHGSFRFSEIGINFTKQLTDKMRMGMQLFAQDLGPAGNFNAKVDWFYLDYRFEDWLGLRAGRLKIPYGLQNEVHDIDAARVPILLPQSVYPIQTREFLFAQNGFELYGFKRLPSVGALDYRFFAGAVFLDAATLTPPGAGYELSFNVPYVTGGRVLWETPLQGLRLGGSLEAIRLDATAFVPDANKTTIKIENRSLLTVASAEYARDNLILTAEYSRWHTEQRGSDPGSTISSLSERGYVIGSYRVTPWLQNGVYYSLLYPDVHNREGRENRQHDVAMTMRFDINKHWLVKLEGHYMEGTAGLASPLRFGPPISDAARSWGVFLLKTTAYF